MHNTSSARRATLAASALAALTLAACQPKTQTQAPQAPPPQLPVLAVSPEQVASLLERRVGQPPQPAFVPGQVVVKLKAGRATAMAAPELRRLQLEGAEALTSGGERIYRIQPTVARAMQPQAVRDRTLELVRALAARADVEYAQPNYVFQIAAVPNDPGFAQQWHYADNGSGAGQFGGGINLPQVWDTNKGSANVVVAVIDTGILGNHPDITGSPNLVAGYDMISDAFIANDGGGRDNDPTDPGDASTAGECGFGSPAQPNSWHGTHVAGTIGVGNTNNGVGVAGINWAVKLQAVRVLGKCGGTMVDINDAIRWAAGLPVPGVPNNATPAKVINMSLGGNSPCSASPATQAAINDAVAAGTTVVVAAGNSAADASGFLPASCNGVVTVAAGDARGYLVTRYSNFGPRVDILAPGGDTQRNDSGTGNDGVLSMVQGGYARYNGTSMASPHVAGVAALMLAARPTLTPAQVLAELKAKALARNATQCPRPCGAGLLDARAATGSGTPPPPPPPPPPGTVVALAPNTATVRIAEATTLVATVSLAGAPQAGKTVQFTSSNAAVATVAPASATTSASGQANVVVTGLTPGVVTITASAEGAVAGATITVAAKLYALNGAVLAAALAALAVVAGMTLLARRRPWRR